MLCYVTYRPVKITRNMPLFKIVILLTLTYAGVSLRSKDIVIRPRSFNWLNFPAAAVL